MYNNQLSLTHIHTMLPTRFRFVNRGLFDRIEFLLGRYTMTDETLKQTLKTSACLLNISTQDTNKERFNNVLHKIEIHLLKKSNYNLVMRNLPNTGVSTETGYSIPVTYQALRETMNQFGDVQSLYIKNGVSYIEMTDNVYTHKTLNQMQLGRNIISTETV